MTRIETKCLIQRRVRVRHEYLLHQKARLGAAVVEFALVAPLMILLTLGMMEIGRVVMVKQLLINASREGARLAVLPGVSSAEVQTQVVEELAAASVSGVAVALTPADIASAAPGTQITVSVSIPANAISWIPNPVFTIDTQLIGLTTMRKESQ